MQTKAGFITIIGKPNAGKSTLMNSLIGAELSIVTAKPQTTRKKILGILTEDSSQFIFNDTPGLLDPKYEMQKSMMDFVDDALEGTDVLLAIFDAESLSKEFEIDEKITKICENSSIKKLAVLNKTDLIKEKKELLPLMEKLNKENLFNELIPISALKKDNVDLVKEKLREYLPESPYFYDEEIISTQTERFFAAETIREFIFKYYGDEVPYSTEVQISDFKERAKGKWYIAADIIIERTSQKMIIIGKNGEKIKRIGKFSREKIEQHLQVPVYLELFVKVRDKWRNNKNLLESYGYSIKK